jgi:hypothetical protein
MTTTYLIYDGSECLLSKLEGYWKGSGSITFSGSAEPQAHFYNTGNGSIRFSGTSIPRIEVSLTGSGEIDFSGIGVKGKFGSGTIRFSGSASKPYMTFFNSPSGSLSFSGTTTPKIEFQNTPEGGIEFFGAASRGTWHNLGQGGIDFGGSALCYAIVPLTFSGSAGLYSEFKNVGSGGITFSGKGSRGLFGFSKVSCDCSVIPKVVGGSISFYGAATVSVEPLGGLFFGGNATVDRPDVLYHGLAACWALDDSLGPYADRSEYGLNSLASDDPTQLNTGVGCSPCQLFDGKANYCKFNLDSLSETKGFTVSFWLKPEEFAQSRIIFARGNTLSIGLSYLNHLWVNITLNDVYSDELLTEDVWCHCAITWIPGDGIYFYRNGIQIGYSCLIANRLVSPSGFDWLGTSPEAGYLSAYLQEVRLHKTPQSQSYLKAEYDNFCSPNFYTVSAGNYYPNDFSDDFSNDFS